MPGDFGDGLVGVGEVEEAVVEVAVLVTDGEAEGVEAGLPAALGDDGELVFFPVNGDVDGVGVVVCLEQEGARVGDGGVVGKWNNQILHGAGQELVVTVEGGSTGVLGEGGCLAETGDWRGVAVRGADPPVPGAGGELFVDLAGFFPDDITGDGACGGEGGVGAELEAEAEAGAFPGKGGRVVGEGGVRKRVLGVDDGAAVDEAGAVDFDAFGEFAGLAEAEADAGGADQESGVGDLEGGGFFFEVDGFVTTGEGAAAPALDVVGPAGELFFDAVGEGEGDLKDDFTVSGGDRVELAVVGGRVVDGEEDFVLGGREGGVFRFFLGVGGGEELPLEFGQHDGFKAFFARVDAVGDEAEKFGGVAFEEFFPAEVVADEGDAEFPCEVGVGLVVIEDVGAGGGAVEFLFWDIGDDVHGLEDDFDGGVGFAEGGDDAGEVGDRLGDGDFVGLVGVVDAELDEDDVGPVFDDPGKDVETALSGGVGGGTGAFAVVEEGGLAGVVGIEPVHHRGGPFPGASGEGGAHGGDAKVFALVKGSDEGARGGEDRVERKGEDSKGAGHCAVAGR